MRIKELLLPLCLIIAVLLSYGLTTRMYFWQDDSALIFRLQNPVGQMGSFGLSIWGDRGSYRYLAIPFIPFYPLFHLEPFGYFVVGLLTYFIATLCFFYFAKEIFREKKLATIASFIFAAGYVGSDMMFRIINSWQSNIGLVLSLLSLYFYTRFTNKNENKYYFLSLLFYLGSIELVFIRSHSLVASIVILGLIFRKRSFLGSIFRLLPFVLLFYLWYLKNPSFVAPGLNETGLFATLFGTAGNSLFPSILSGKLISLFGNYTPWLILIVTAAFFVYLNRRIERNKIFLVLGFLGSTAALFVNYLIYLQKYYWYKDLGSFASATIGVLAIFNITYSGLLAWRNNNRIGKILIVGSVVLMSQIFGYFIQYPTSIFPTTHRYLYFTLIGYSLIYSGLFSLLSKKVYYTLSFFLVVTNIILSLNYQVMVLHDRSEPTRVFYQTLMKNVQKVDKGSIFYFDVSDDPFYQKQFGDFFSVGSMPESTALAIYYGLDRDDIVYLTNFDELVSILSQNPEKINRVYAFYYGHSGLINETQILRDLLVNKNQRVTPNVSKGLEEGLKIFPEKGLSSQGYLEVNFNAKVKIDKEKLSLVKKHDMTETEKNLILSYFDARKRFYNEVNVESLSEWKYQEVSNLKDADTDTAWRGHRIYWDDNEHDQLIIDLGRNETVSRFVWTNWTPSLTPTSYRLEASKDGENWSEVVKVENGQEKNSSQRVVESFIPVEARFMKMDITATLTNDSPAISEVEVIESKYGSIDLQEVNDFLQSPFSITSDPPSNTTNIKVTLRTNKGEVTKEVPIARFNAEASYSVYLYEGGTEVENMIFTVPDPLTMDITSVNVSNLNLEKMQRLGLVKKFSTN